MDWAERLISGQVCKDRGVESIDEIGYAKGYTFALTYWREILTALDWLRDECGLMVILIAHSKIERFENPEAEAYDRYSPKLHRLASAVVQEWCDEVLFANYRTYAKSSGEYPDQQRQHFSLRDVKLSLARLPCPAASKPDLRDRSMPASKHWWLASGNATTAWV